MSCLLRLIIIFFGSQLLAGASTQLLFNLNVIPTEKVFWIEFFKELTTRPPFYVMILGMVFLFIGVCYPLKKR
ncbi:hypothetical protein HOO54_17415 [Bacillus sp. WMMC1349]|uniref:hypothetical protein n=1 Tax=Bacillus sp. WMMC1349 TaxID=2736254 RepID=UPI00155369D4|nr:hypothetical protein [Bacillus sp. WMMC1349]NPC93945.1 hypothetical protein [Bacillus sp. WMMC1349]